jgi:membrane protein implicated in regulation of membrane protease activity
MVGYSPAEYGVRKDDGGGLVKPYNSSAGLLFLAVLMSLVFCLMVYGLIQIAITGQWDILGRTWWMYVVFLYPLFAAWYSYFKESKAEKLRKARNLSRPVE